MISKKLRLIAGVQMLAFALLASAATARSECDPGPPDRMCDSCVEDYLGNWQDEEGYWRDWWWFGVDGLECDFFETWQVAEQWGEVTWEYQDYESVCWEAEFDCESWEGGNGGK